MRTRLSSTKSKQTRPSSSMPGLNRGFSPSFIQFFLAAILVLVIAGVALPTEKSAPSKGGQTSPPGAGASGKTGEKEKPSKTGRPGVSMSLKNFRLRAFDSMIEFTRGPKGKRGAIYVLMGNVELVGKAAAEPPGEVTLQCENAVVWVDWSRRKEGKTPVREFYAEGNVRLAQSGAIFQGNAVYFDFETGDGIVLDARIQTTQAQERSLRRSALAELGVMHGNLNAIAMDLFIRAEVIRVKGWRAFSGKNIILSPVGFIEPPWGLESEKFEFHSDGTISARGNWFKAGLVKIPLFPLEIERDWRPPLKRLHYRSSRYFGNHVRTTWELFAKRWRLPPTPESPARTAHAAFLLDADYYRLRGDALGLGLMLESKFRRGTNPLEEPERLGLPPPKYKYQAILHGYHIQDGGIEDAKYPFPRDDRGRLRFVGRYRFSDTASMEAEVSRLSDEYFLLDYFEDEYKEGKEQQTYASFTKTWGDKGVELYAKKRLNTFLTRTEYLPAFTGHVLSSELGYGFTASGRLEAANLAWRPASGLGNNSHEILRADLLTEVARPFGLKRYLNLRPSVFGRVSAYETGRLREQPVNRTTFGVACRLTTELSRVFKAESKLLDIHKIRHVINPEVVYRYAFYNNVDPGELFNIDKTDTIGEEQTIDFILRNRLQTKRTRKEKGKEITDIVNLLDFELEARYFPQEKRDNDGKRFGLGEAELIFTPTPSFTLEVNAEFSGHGVHRFESCDVGVTYRRPTWKIYFANRYTRDQAANMVGSVSFKVGEKWAFELTHEADAYTNTMRRKEYSVVRNFYGWKLEVSYEVDYDDKDHAIGVHLIPPGFKQAKKFFRRRYDRLD